MQAAAKKCILFLGNFDNNVERIRDAVAKGTESSNVKLVFTYAQNGMDASMKVTNQKYDIILVDTDVPRLFDGGFVHTIPTHKNISKEDVYIVSDCERDQLHPSLKAAHYFRKSAQLEELIQTLIDAIQKSATLKGPAQFHVDVRVLNAVIKSTLNVCEQFGLKNVTMQKAEPTVIDSSLQGEVASLMPIKSKAFNGALITSFDKGSFLHMVSTMLGEEQKEITPDIADAIGEICNIIFGNAKSDFTQYGVEMATPKILAANEPLMFPQTAARITIPFSLDGGKFYMDIIALADS